jgi:hypothetical protein
MYSLSSLIVELETARRRLLYVFGAPDGTLTSGLGTQPVPEGLAAELASDQAPPTRLAFAARINHAPRIGRSCEVGINLDSLNCRKRSPKSAAAPRQIPAALANKGLGDELDQNRYQPMSPT